MANLTEPREDEFSLRQWRRDVNRELNELFPFSVFSTQDGPNTSGETAAIGTIGIDIGSSTTRLWVAGSDATNDWREVK